jgi:hypothetical protein
MQQPTSDPLRASANLDCFEKRKRASQRTLQALGMAILGCLTMSWASAQNWEADPVATDKVGDETQSSVELRLPPLVIEGQATHPDPTEEQLMQKFRQALGQPAPLIVAEHRFSDGTLELTTRLGHFCGKPLPPHLESALGGYITLAAPCAWF